MSILVSEEASQHFIKSLERRGGVGIRLGVRTTGCSGLAYVVEFVDKADEHDIVQDFEGFKIFVDPKSHVYIDGLSIEYEKSGLQEGISIKNAKESGRCGCGESFTV
jgi:iron-sulfur cluster assembly protein